MKRLAFWWPGKRSRNWRSMRPNSCRRHCGGGREGWTALASPPATRSTHQLGIPLLHAPARMLDLAQLVAALGHEPLEVRYDLLLRPAPTPRKGLPARPRSREGRCHALPLLHERVQRVQGLHHLRRRVLTVELRFSLSSGSHSRHRAQTSLNVEAWCICHVKAIL